MMVEQENPQEDNETNGSQAAQVLLSAEEEALRNELSAWQSKANEYLDGWQRARAEFATYTKRVEREQTLAHQNASAAVIKRFLEVLDDLERALKNRPQDGDGATPGWRPQSEKRVADIMLPGMATNQSQQARYLYKIALPG